MTSQNRRARPFYKSPANLQAPARLTRRTALTLIVYIRCKDAEKHGMTV